MGIGSVHNMYKISYNGGGKTTVIVVSTNHSHAPYTQNVFLMQLIPTGVVRKYRAVTSKPPKGN